MYQSFFLVLIQCTAIQRVIQPNNRLGDNFKCQLLLNLNKHILCKMCPQMCRLFLFYYFTGWRNHNIRLYLLQVEVLTFYFSSSRFFWSYFYCYPSRTFFYLLQVTTVYFFYLGANAEVEYKRPRQEVTPCETIAPTNPCGRRAFRPRCFRP